MAEPDWDAVAELFGAERVVLARPTVPDWSLSAARLEPRDQLYRTLLRNAEPELESPTPRVLDMTLLGDTGRRMLTAGVKRLLVVAGPEPGSLVIAENPSGPVGESIVPADLDSLLAEAPASSSRLGVVAEWVAAVATLPGQPLVSPAGATTLARVLGADLVAFVWSSSGATGGPGAAEVCWGGADAGRRSVQSLSWPLPDDHVVVAAELDALTTRPPVAPWGIVIAERGPLAVAVSPPPRGSRALRVVADLLAFDAERSRTTPDGRQHSLLEERVRIAGLVHDGVTQQVSNVMIQLQLLELASEDPARLRETLRMAREATAAALEELRASLYELAPRLSTMGDLVPSLRDWCRDYSAQWGVDVTVEVDGQERPVDPEMSMLAYAVVQEGLTNVRKHADADSVAVRVGFASERLTIEVRDDGRGFAEAPPEPTGSGRRMGLRLLRDRVRSAGGTLDVVSRPGAGSEVVVRLPI